MQCLSMISCGLTSAIQNVAGVRTSLGYKRPRLGTWTNQKGHDRVWGRQAVESRKSQLMQSSQEADTQAESGVQVMGEYE